MTFSDKNPSRFSADSYRYIYMIDNPADTIFFKTIGKDKDAINIERDKIISENNRKIKGLYFLEGEYYISPCDNLNKYLFSDSGEIKLMNEKSRIFFIIGKNKYHFLIGQPNIVIGYEDKHSVDEQILLTEKLMDVVGRNCETQQWMLKEEVNGYSIINSNNGALTYNENDSSVKIKEYMGEKNQIWKIEKCENKV